MMMRKTRLKDICALGFILCHLTGIPASGEVVERIVAIVNDEIITMSDLNKYSSRLKSGGLVDEMLIPDEATKEALQKDRSKLLSKMIDERIIDSEIKKQNLSIPIEKVEAEIRSIAKRNNVTREELKKALQERGIVFSNYQDFIKTGLERQSLIEKSITSKIKVSEDDVMAAYVASHGQSQDQAFEFTISQIFFDSNKGGAKSAQGRADAAIKRLNEGESFEKLAADLSEDPGFEAGGLLGTFKTGELQKDLESAAVKLSAGEVSRVVPAPGGFRILKMNKKRLISDPRTEKEREKIRAQLSEQAYKKQFQSWLDQLRSEAFIRINE